MIIIGCLLLVIAVITIGIAVIFLCRENLLKRNGVTVNATVIKIDRVMGNDKKVKQYFPILQFSTGTGKVKVRSNVGSVESVYKVGQLIPIIYHKDEPERISIKGDNSVNLIIGVFTLIGLLCLIIGGVLIYFA